MRLSTLVLLMTIIALGACARDKPVRCNNDANYLEAETVGQLRIPDDLNVPDEIDALRIPGPSPEPAVSEGELTECLEHSPAFQQQN